MRDNNDLSKRCHCSTCDDAHTSPKSTPCVSCYFIAVGNEQTIGNKWHQGKGITTEHIGNCEYFQSQLNQIEFDIEMIKKYIKMKSGVL